MNKIVIKFLLAGDKFMPEMHLRQPGFNIVLRDHLQKPKKEYKNLKICRKKLHKACFRDDMADGDLSRRKTSDKMFRDKGLILLKIRSMMNINKDLLWWFIIFLIKKLQVELLKIKLCLVKN